MVFDQLRKLSIMVCHEGSVLDPLLFIIYLNDLPESLTYCKPIIFADDTTLFHAGTNNLFEHVNYDLKQLSDWFRANQLSVNTSKTKYMFFSKQQFTNTGMYLAIDDDTFSGSDLRRAIGLARHRAPKCCTRRVIFSVPWSTHKQTPESGCKDTYNTSVTDSDTR